MSNTPQTAIARPRAVAKRLEVRIFAPGNKSSHAIHLFAGDRRMFTEEGVSEILEKVATDIAQRFPNEEYRLVELSEGKFNFVWAESKGNG